MDLWLKEELEYLWNDPQKKKEKKSNWQINSVIPTSRFPDRFVSPSCCIQTLNLPRCSLDPVSMPLFDFYWLNHRIVGKFRSLCRVVQIFFMVFLFLVFLDAVNTYLFTCSLVICTHTRMYVYTHVYTEIHTHTHIYIQHDTNTHAHKNIPTLINKHTYKQTHTVIIIHPCIYLSKSNKIKKFVVWNVHIPVFFNGLSSSC